MAYEIVVDYNPLKEDDDLIQEKLFNYETKELLKDIPKHFSIFIKSKSDAILGGALVWIHTESIYIMTLWVDKNLRGLGLGTKLLNIAEAGG